jgi:hypothetical protein
VKGLAAPADRLDMQFDLSAGGCASHPPEGGSRECEVVLGGDHNRHGPSGIALAIDAQCCRLFRPVARGARYDFAPSRQRSVEFRDLKWAIIASHHRSLRQAAEALDIRQSTLSRRLRDMEARLGAQLFERTNGGTRPLRVANSWRVLSPNTGLRSVTELPAL